MWTEVEEKWNENASYSNLLKSSLFILSNLDFYLFAICFFFPLSSWNMNLKHFDISMPMMSNL